jgi:hypothetical protein
VLIVTPDPAVGDSGGGWPVLVEGGHVALIRHGNAPPGYGGDPPGFKIDDCKTQRNLDELGRRQARALGEAFRSRGVRVGRVLSSPWCRCLETARLMAVGPVETTWALVPDRDPTAALETACWRRRRASTTRKCPGAAARRYPWKDTQQSPRRRHRGNVSWGSLCKIDVSASYQSGPVDAIHWFGVGFARREPPHRSDPVVSPAPADPERPLFALAEWRRKTVMRSSFARSV